MLKQRNKRFAGIRKRTLVMAAMAVLVPMTALASASSAAAEPMGIFKIFKYCPLEYVPFGLEACTVANTNEGEFKIGTVTVPITGSKQTITLQGGNIPTGNPENPAEYFALPAKAPGESLSKTELNVPGGLTDFINCTEIKGEWPLEKALRSWCKSVFEGTLLGVTATTELVANAENPVIFNEFAFTRREGPALTLPVRVHLKNPLLGNACYIGSTAHPLQLHLTTGETHPPKGFTSLKGSRGTGETLEEKGFELLRLVGTSLVDNTFSAPAPEGCGEFTFLGTKYTGILDFLLEAKLKIPNKAGENAAVLTGEQQTTGPENVIASESF
jgi:hypothetical protein